MRAIGVGTLAAVLLSACGGSSSVTTQGQSRPTTPGMTKTVAAHPASPASAPAKAKATPKPRSKPDPGSLPQTDQRPSTDTPGFRAEMQALWAGVAQNSLATATPAFFPEGAYVQLKAIGDAQGDYAGRLLGDLRLDLAAAHALLAPDPGSAHLIGVALPPSSVHWVPPEACYNRVGYYEWPNARLVYRQNGVVRSFGIASMISWRGVWYVVHLGAVVRSSDTGVVDDPSSGTGTSVPSSTC